MDENWGSSSEQILSDLHLKGLLKYSGEKGDAHPSRRNTVYKGTEMPKGKMCWGKCFRN